MALNKAVFRTRALTAVVFVIVMLVGLLINHWSFFILFSIIHFGCWWEYLKLTEKIHQAAFHPYTKLGFMLTGYGLMLLFCGSDSIRNNPEDNWHRYAIAGYGLKENLSLPVSAAGFALLLIGIFQKNRISVKAFGMAALGVVYISLSWGLLMDIRCRTSLFYPDAIDRTGLLIPLVIIGSIWINDTMAYISGSFIGKTPLSKISPKKTWEGTIGGIILCIAVVGFTMMLIAKNQRGGMPGSGYKFIYEDYQWFIIAAIAGIAGTFGDLLESKLKRMAGVKDSGSLMPGHGGFLDRFDSLLIAIPFVWIYLACFTKWMH